MGGKKELKLEDHLGDWSSDKKWLRTCGCGGGVEKWLESGNFSKVGAADLLVSKIFGLSNWKGKIVIY